MNYVQVYKEAVYNALIEQYLRDSGIVPPDWTWTPCRYIPTIPPIGSLTRPDRSTSP